jgi:hypothetical protein
MRGRPSCFSSRLGSLKSSMHPLLVIERSNSAKTPSLRTWPFRRASRVHPLLVEKEIDAYRRDFRHEANEVLNAPSQTSTALRLEALPGLCDGGRQARFALDRHIAWEPDGFLQTSGIAGPALGRRYRSRDVKTRHLTRSSSPRAPGTDAREQSFTPDQRK